LEEEIHSLGFSMMTMTSLAEASGQVSASKDKSKIIQSRKVEEAWECVWGCLKMMMTSSVTVLEEALGAAVCFSKCKWVEAAVGFRHFHQVRFLAAGQDLHRFPHKRIWKMERK